MKALKLSMSGRHFTVWVRHSLFLLLVGLFTTITFAQDQEDENQDYFVEAFVSNPTPYVGEEIIYTLRYYAYTLDGILAMDAPIAFPAFTGFWLNDVNDRDFRIEVVNNIQYNVGERVAEITPLSEGEITIDPAILSIEDQVFLSGGIFVSNAVTVDVQPLPQGAPAEFNDAVGRYSVITEIDTTSVVLGEPITLTMDIQGVGNLDLLPAPIIELGSRLADSHHTSNPSQLWQQ